MFSTQAGARSTAKDLRSALRKQGKPDVPLHICQDVVAQHAGYRDWRDAGVRLRSGTPLPVTRRYKDALPAMLLDPVFTSNRPPQEIKFGRPVFPGALSPSALKVEDYDRVVEALAAGDVDAVVQAFDPSLSGTPPADRNVFQDEAFILLDLVTSIVVDLQYSGTAPAYITGLRHWMNLANLQYLAAATTAAPPLRTDDDVFTGRSTGRSVRHADESILSTATKKKMTAHFERLSLFDKKGSFWFEMERAAEEQHAYRSMYWTRAFVAYAELGLSGRTTVDHYLRDPIDMVRSISAFLAPTAVERMLMISWAVRALHGRDSSLKTLLVTDDPGHHPVPSVGLSICGTAAFAAQTVGTPNADLYVLDLQGCTNVDYLRKVLATLRRERGVIIFSTIGHALSLPADISMPNSRILSRCDAYFYAPDDLVVNRAR